MIRNGFGSGLFLAAAGAALVLASALPVAAAFTVSVKGATATVTQHDPTTLFVARNPAGELEVSDGGPVEVHPSSTNLVVRGVDLQTVPAGIQVVLNSALPGSLTLDLPGACDVTVRGGVASIHGGLTVKGSDAVAQVIRLGAAGAPVTIDGPALLDMRGGMDVMMLMNVVSVGGSLTTKGVNQITGGPLVVGGNFSMDGKREDLQLVLNTGPHSLVVGKALDIAGGPASDLIVVNAGSIGRNVKIELGDDGAGVPQVAALQIPTIGGNLTVAMGSTGQNQLVLPTGTDIGGSVKVTMEGAENIFTLNADVEGSSIKYTGGDGRDQLSIVARAPRAKAVIRTKGDMDFLNLQPGTQLKALDVDFGDGFDQLAASPAVLPPGAKITNLP